MQLQKTPIPLDPIGPEPLISPSRKKGILRTLANLGWGLE